MFERPPFDDDRSFTAWLDRDAFVRPPDALLGTVIERTAATRRRPAWLILERWFPMETTARFGAVPKTVLILVTLGLALLLATTFAVGAQPSPVPYPPGPGAFTTTAPQDVARTYHAAVPLSDGRILLAGGRDTTGEEIDSAALWDPETRAFAPLASRSPVGETFGVPLVDGRALIVGRDAAAVWDPGDLTFHATGPYVHPYREVPSLVLLADGRALLVGGLDRSGNAIAEVEVFDPATNAWSAAGSLARGRCCGTANLLPDGSVLVAGGAAADVPVAQTELWDPTTGTFGAGPDLLTPRSGPAEATLADGRVLIFGGTGETPDAAIATAEVYDPATGTFSAAGTLTYPRQVSATATLLPDGRVLVVGGFEAWWKAPIGPSEIWEAGSFSPAATLIQARGGHTATLLQDGSVLIVGGWEGETAPPITMGDDEVWTPGPAT
jgi:hypothetical protein